MMLKGLLLKESLKDDCILNLVRITSSEVWDIQAAAEDQPASWNAIRFETDDDLAGAFAEKLSPNHQSGQNRIKYLYESSKEIKNAISTVR
jgi:hypothetical protein